jgi:hypothetical protein
MPIGCAAYQATQQPDKKNLAVLTPGIDRKNVIAELGQPLCTEMRGQTLTDVFAFKQGYTRGTKAGRALVHGAADVLTGGLWEVVGIPIEALASGQDVQAQVSYDAMHMVERVDVMKGQDAVRSRPLFSWLAKSKTGVFTGATATRCARHFPIPP